MGPQPGSRIDYEWVTEQVTLTFRSPAEFTVRSGRNLTAAKDTSWRFCSARHHESAERIPVEPTSEQRRVPARSGLGALARTPGPASLPLHRLQVPAPAKRQRPSRQRRWDVPELKGNWARGRRVFLQRAGRLREAPCVRWRRRDDRPQPVEPVEGITTQSGETLPSRVTRSTRISSPQWYPVVTVASRPGRCGLKDNVYLLASDGKVTTVLKAWCCRRTAAKPGVAHARRVGQATRVFRSRCAICSPSSVDRTAAEMPDYGKGNPWSQRSRKEVAAALANARIPRDRSAKDP